MANDTRSEIVQDYHRASNKKLEKLMEKKITRKEARQMEKERQGTKARGVVLFWGEAPQNKNTGNPKFRLRGV